MPDRPTLYMGRPLRYNETGGIIMTTEVYDWMKNADGHTFSLPGAS